MKIQQSVAAILGLVSAVPALAHIGYSGRDFGTLDGLVTTGSTITGKSVTSNAGWADAADNSASDKFIWGDSHKAAAFTFILTNTSSVTFSVVANTASNTGVGNVSSLLPGFSIYEGKASVSPHTPPQTSADYDYSSASAAWLLNANPAGANFPFQAYSGVWNAMGDWKVGGDGDPVGNYSALTSFSYKGSAFDSDLNGSASGTFLLGPGTYSVFVGGNNYADYGNPLKFGLNASLAVAAVPEPESYAMLLAGLGLIGAIARRRKENRTHQD